MFVPVIGGVLLKLSAAYLGKKENAQVINMIRENNEYTASNLLVNMQNLRAKNLKTVRRLTLDIESGEHSNNSKWIDKAQMIQERDYAWRVVQAIPQMNIESLGYLTALDNKLEKLLSHFVEPEIKNETLQDVLDYTGANYQQYMETLLKYAVYSSQSLPFGRPAKPELSPFERNYRSICTYYGKKPIDSIMMGLVDEFVNEGGNDLYYELANSFKNAPSAFIDYARYISSSKETQVDKEQYNEQPAHIIKMFKYYHLGAE